MGAVTGTVVYVILWWLVFMCILPVAVRTATEAGSKVEPGHADSAPVQPFMWRKVLATTLITAVLWCGYYWLQGSGLITFRPDLRPGEHGLFEPTSHSREIIGK